jgi:hypothetical protein
MTRRIKALLAAGAIMAGIVVIPWLVPLLGFIPKLEAMVSQRTNQPVTIGALQLALVPLPHLTLADVSIGTAPLARAGRIEFWPAVVPWLGGEKVLREVRLEDVSVREEFFDMLNSLPRADGARAQVRIERIVLKDQGVDAAGRAAGSDRPARCRRRFECARNRDPRRQRPLV